MPHNPKKETRDVIRALHGCESVYVTSVPVKETFKGQTAWEGVVDVFYLQGHAETNCCFAWSYEDHGETKWTTVLAVPPVHTPMDAVKAAIAAKARM